MPPGEFVTIKPKFLGSVPQNYANATQAGSDSCHQTAGALYNDAMAKKPFHKPPSKSDLRDDLNADVESFLRSGGEISAIAQGETALERHKGPLQAPLFNEPRTSRTPVDDVVAALKARKEAKHTRPKTAATRRQRPKKKVIYDDFGEPLRTVWSDD